MYTRAQTRLARPTNDISYIALAVGSDSVAYAFCISMKSRPSDDEPIASGWYILAKLRYAVLISFSDAVLSTLSTSYKLPLARVTAVAAFLLPLAVADLKDGVCTELLTVSAFPRREIGEKLLMGLAAKEDEDRAAYIG